MLAAVNLPVKTGCDFELMLKHRPRGQCTGGKLQEVTCFTVAQYFQNTHNPIRVPLIPLKAPQPLTTITIGIRSQLEFQRKQAVAR